MIYKTKEFAALIKKSNLSDEDLLRACEEMSAGLVDADLGSGLYKKRISLNGQGKRGGYRTLMGASLGNRYFFLYAFAKNDRANINARETLALKELSRLFLSFETNELIRLVETGELIEVGRVK